MALSNTEYGKAYEYACLIALRNHLFCKSDSEITIQESDTHQTAKSAFEKAERGACPTNWLRRRMRPQG